MVSGDSSDEDYKDAAKYAGIVPEDLEDTDRINNLVAKARALYNAGDYNAAVLAFREAQECDPQAPGRYQHANNLSACMLRLEDYEGALKYTKLVLTVRVTIAESRHHWCTRCLKTLLLTRHCLLLLSPATCFSDINVYR